MDSSRKIEIAFFLCLSVLAVGVAFFVFKPYLSALFIALVLSLVFNPLYARMKNLLPGGTLAACAALVVLLLLILIPAALFGFFIFDDAQRLYVSLRGGEETLSALDQWSTLVEAQIQAFVPEVRFNLSSYLTDGLSFLLGNFGSIFSRAVGFVFKAIIMLLALFYLFRDGEKLRAFVVRLSPLTNEYDERILTRIEDAINSVVRGKLLIVFIQGILSTLIFLIFGVPHPVLLGALTALAALVPAVGVALIFIPVVLYGFFAGQTASAIGLLISGVCIGFIDNILGPIFFKRGLRVHPLLILLSVLGGLALFGPVGFLAGPVTLSLLFALFDIYPFLFSEQKQ